ncbi:DUF6265 family protein [Winogradskyella sp.]|uniref:DUF6265 family protein n=1 Tax=Winogradskyella sp. TaxID=1883156 RepID=UPI003BA93E19
MKTLRLVIVLLLLTTYSAYSQNANLQQLEFLIGIWKIEGKESYESWEKKKDKLIGQSYKIKNGQSIVTEHLELKVEKNQIIYTPIVLNQNDGKGIPFKLKLLQQKVFSFENPHHDFPKKIQYKILNANELQVSVLGDDDKGFSYKLIKQSQ